MEKMADFTQRSQEEKDHIAQLHNTINKLREKVHDYEEREKEHKKDLVLKTQAMIQIKKVVEAETIQFVEQSRQLAERIEEVKELKQRCESYQLEAEELRSAIGSLQKDTSGMERVIESQLEQDLNSMQFELDEKSEKVAKLTSQISELHEEIEYLKSENNREKTRADNLELSKEALIGKIEALDSLNLEEKTKIGILETELENLQKKINDKDLMCNNKAETIDKHHQTSPSKSLEEKSVSDEVQAKLASLASDKQILLKNEEIYKKELSSRAETITMLQDKFKQMNDYVDQEERINAQTLKEFENLRVEYNELTERFNSSAGELKKLENQERTSKKIIKDLKDDINNKIKKIDSLKEALDEINKTAEKADAEVQVNEGNNSQGIFNGLESETVAENMQSSTKPKEEHLLLIDVSEKNLQLESQISEMLAQTEHHLEQIRMLEEKCQSQESLLVSKESELTQLLEKDNQTLVAFEHFKIEADTQKDTLAKRDQQLKEILEQFAILKGQYEQTSTKARNLKFEQGSMITELKEKQVTIDEISNKLHEQTEQVTRLSQQLQAAYSSDQQSKSTKAALMSLQSEKQDLEDTLRIKDDQLADLENHVTNLNHKLKTLETSCSIMNEQIVALSEKQITENQDQIINLEAELMNSKSRIQELEDMLNQLQADRDSVQALLGKEQANLTIYTKTIEDLESNLSEKVQLIAQLEEEQKRLDLSATREEYSQSGRQISSYIEQIENLESQLKEAQRDLEDMTDQKNKIIDNLSRNIKQNAPLLIEKEQEIIRLTEKLDSSEQIIQKMS